MKTKTIILSLTLCLTILFSCNDENKIAKTLPGIWDLNKVEFFSASDANASFSATNAGTIEFKNDGTGKNAYTYTVGSESYNNNESFKWENTDVDITIIGNSNTGVKERVFTIDDFEKESQVWINVETDKDSLIYTLTKQK
jgi:hypothetical protein